ncbi:DUF6147 family protein [[Ruminococcus] torques]|uniref:DUF6147 family protein n=1 Tax=[Ruminococcus] torques TaxID=33039 RepID=UPI0025A3E709|nr:DUF6147 family protein [[Ruminococcus] torques]MDM8236038.1 DUF6147 family protein [[Ruminococcus] torques]
MKRRFLSSICSLLMLGMMLPATLTDVEASEKGTKKVDGSYLTLEDSSSGKSTDKLRGKYLMTGDCTISKAGRGKVYAYASTTANQEVNYMATLVYVEKYMEDVDEWGQVDWWVVEAEDEYFLSTAKTIYVDGGYYYRVRANHIAGDEYPYEETASFTDGIFIK